MAVAGNGRRSRRLDAWVTSPTTPASGAGATPAGGGAAAGSAADSDGGSSCGAGDGDATAAATVAADGRPRRTVHFGETVTLLREAPARGAGGGRKAGVRRMGTPAALSFADGLPAPDGAAAAAAAAATADGTKRAAAEAVAGGGDV